MLQIKELTVSAIHRETAATVQPRQSAITETLEALHPGLDNFLNLCTIMTSATQNRVMARRSSDGQCSTEESIPKWTSPATFRMVLLRRIDTLDNMDLFVFQTGGHEMGSLTLASTLPTAPVQGADSTSLCSPGSASSKAPQSAMQYASNFAFLLSQLHLTVIISVISSASV
jgi:hypothetical protein